MSRRTTFRAVFAAGAALILASCVNSAQEERNGDAAILLFAIGDTVGAVTGGEIAALAPGDADLSALAPEIAVSRGASLSPASGAPQDFSAGPVIYTVTAENGAQKLYRATVTLDTAWDTLHPPPFDSLEALAGYCASLTLKNSRDAPVELALSENFPAEDLGGIIAALDHRYSILDMSACPAKSLEAGLGNNDYLLEITLPKGLETLGASALYGCAALQRVAFPQPLKTIGGQALAYCGSLTAVSLPASLVSIGTEAFRGCGNLARVSLSRWIPPSTITAHYGSSVFAECPLLERIYVPRESVETYRAAAQWNRLADKIMAEEQ
jgi:hypothetical protein